jgi:hypothetical protein
MNSTAAVVFFTSILPKVNEVTTLLFRGISQVIYKWAT